MHYQETITATFTKPLGDKGDFALARYENGSNLDEVKVSGPFSGVMEAGDWFTATGYWPKTSSKPADARYKSQAPIFRASIIQPAMPITRKGIADLLVTTFDKDVHGITGAAVDAFVEKHGLRAALKAEQDPEILVEISSDPIRFRHAIQRDWARRISSREPIRVLEGAKLEQDTIREILGHFRDNTMTVIRRNPYELSRVPGVDFADIDRLGRKLGVDTNDQRRVRAALEHLAAKEIEGGHTYVPWAALTPSFKGLGITADGLKPVVGDQSQSNVVVDRKTGFVQSKGLMRAEERVARRLRELMQRRSTLDLARIDAVAKQVLSKPEYADLRSDPSQVAAVLMCVKEIVSGLKGGPGTGKSFVTKAIAEIVSLTIRGKVLLAAPAAKAVRRQVEATENKYEAATIHKTLLYQGGKDGAPYLINAGRPLEAGCFVIIDETSMLDVALADALLDAIPPDGRILFVGDSAQLRSVEAGNFFGDMQTAEGPEGQRVPFAELTTVHRQKGSSMIPVYAKEMREGRFSAARLDDTVRGGIGYWDMADRDIVDKVTRLATISALQKGLDIMKGDVSVLCPMKKGTAGTWQINRAISLAKFPKRSEVPGLVRPPGPDRDEPVPVVGDRVMFTENDNENEVSNGEIGTLTRWYNDRDTKQVRVVVKLDTGEEKHLTVKEAQKLICAYAITIHKSQGSQYPLAIMPLTMAHKSMLDRNLVYTGWTRAKDRLFLVGDMAALEYAVANTTGGDRRTCLSSYLSSQLAGLPKRNPMLEAAQLAKSIATPAPAQPERQPATANTSIPAPAIATAPAAPAPSFRRSTASLIANRTPEPVARPVEKAAAPSLAPQPFRRRVAFVPPVIEHEEADESFSSPGP
jgi:exodeoxyribonuclease V alpha subunit